MKYLILIALILPINSHADAKGDHAGVEQSTAAEYHDATEGLTEEQLDHLYEQGDATGDYGEIDAA